MRIQKESVLFWARVLLCAILLCLGAFVFTEEAFPWWVNLIVFLLSYRPLYSRRTASNVW